jgi:putative salt-induced outer membrane protein
MPDFKRLLAAAILGLGAAAAVAEEPDGVWRGEGALALGYTTGNTETRDLGLGVGLTRATRLWRTSVEAAADYGRTDGTDTKNRIFLAGDGDRFINERLFGFGRVSHELDEFSGFDSRSFVGGGLGYEILTGERASWSVRGGPGVKIDRVRSRIETGVPEDIVIPGRTEESFSIIAASKYSYVFNDNVRLRNETSLVTADESTQIGNILGLTAALNTALSARVSVEVRHETDPPPGFTATDTATRFSLVYKIGG